MHEWIDSVPCQDGIVKMPCFYSFCVSSTREPDYDVQPIGLDLGYPPRFFPEKDKRRALSLLAFLCLFPPERKDKESNGNQDDCSSWRKVEVERNKDS